MKIHIVLQAQSSLQAYSKHLRVYVQIVIMEQGKLWNVECFAHVEAVVRKNFGYNLLLSKVRVVA